MNARLIAAEIVEHVLKTKQPLDETLDYKLKGVHMDDRDKAFARALAITTFRQLGRLNNALNSCIERGLPKNAGLLHSLLLTASAQILFMNVPSYAAVNETINIIQKYPDLRHYRAFANAVLRKIAAQIDTFAHTDPLTINTPDWLKQRWIKTYGEKTAAKIALMHTQEAALDLSVKESPDEFAKTINGTLLPNGTIRLSSATVIQNLKGFKEGMIWAQDAAATFPVLIMGNIKGKTALDLCAAPGGKTTQLCIAGANVTAVERSAKRLKRLEANIKRLDLKVTMHLTDAFDFKAKPFDVVLLDAPCSATGTIRRHPEIAWLKNKDDIFKLAEQQKKLLAHAATLTKPGGLLVYAVCSLEKEEGEDVIHQFLATHPQFKRQPVTSQEVANIEEILTEQGDILCLPHHFAQESLQLSGLNGFFCARLQRNG